MKILVTGGAGYVGSVVTADPIAAGNQGRFTTIKEEQHAQTVYREKCGSCLLCDYLQLEIQSRARLVIENDHFAVVVPDSTR